MSTRAYPIPEEPAAQTAAQEGPPIEDRYGPMAAVITGLAKVTSDLAAENRELRERYAWLTEQHQRSLMVIARLAGMPAELVGGVSDEELATVRRAAAATAAGFTTGGTSGQGSDDRCDAPPAPGGSEGGP